MSTIPPALAAAVGAAGDGIIGTEEARTFPIMRDRFSLPAAYAFLLFVLVYFPCVSALGVVIREIGAGYGWLLAGYLTVSAWAIATILRLIGKRGARRSGFLSRSNDWRGMA
ncbi:MAG: hypothetical protein ACOCW3_05755 [Spirochaetota bacterium]